MRSLRAVYFVIAAVYMVALEDVACAAIKDKTFLLRGQVTFSDGSNAPIEPNATATIELQDTSLADAAAKVIARGKGPVRQFPIAFVVKYRASEIIEGHSYSLSVMIRDNKNSLLYINDVRVSVTLVGKECTKFVEVPVILIKKNTPAPPKTRWPELVGKKGKDAVKIIKAETGFTNVQTVREGSPITLDYRTDRVRVFVNGGGIVTTTPVVG